MQAALMNFGDNVRVVRDVRNQQVAVGIGEIKSLDIHEVHFNMIKNGQARETLLVVPQDVKPTEKLAGIMELMPEVSTMDEHALLRRFTDICGPGPDGAVRPSRAMIRIALREAAREEARKTLFNSIAAEKERTRATIREEGDSTTRQEAPGGDTRAPGDLPNPPPDRPKKKAKKAIKRERL